MRVHKPFGRCGRVAYMSLVSCAAILGLGACSSPEPLAPASSPGTAVSEVPEDATLPTTPNILLLIADDFGVESSVCYNDSPSPAPTLEALCSQAIVFDQAWSSPVCSPTRSGILTGRHGFRTGIGEQETPDNDILIRADEQTLPRILDEAESGYAHANFGKWHLGGDVDNPNAMGWSHFSGTLSGGLRDYESWPRVTNGVETQSTTYATTATVDATLEWVGDQAQPWLAWVAFNAPHTPFHLPPSGLHTQDLSGTESDIAANPDAYYDAAVEALDTEIGRLLDSIDLANTTVIFIGDNGSPTQVSSYDRGEAKGSLSEGGVHVPMMVWGAGVTGPGRTDALVGTVDIFSTILDLAGVDLASLAQPPVVDSVSFAPVLRGGEGDRTYLLAEIFGENTRRNQAGAAIRDADLKVVEYENGRTEVFDLVADPRGDAPIPNGRQTADQQARSQQLLDVMDVWRSDPEEPPPL